jgi:hypothetical protein
MRQIAAVDATTLETAKILGSKGTLCTADSAPIELREEIHRVEAMLESLYGHLQLSSDDKGDSLGADRTASRLTVGEDSGVGADAMACVEDGLALRAELEASVKSASTRIAKAYSELLEAQQQGGEWEALANALEEELGGALAQIDAEATARLELSDRVDELQSEINHLRETEDELRGELAASGKVEQGAPSHLHNCVGLPTIPVDSDAQGSLADEMRAVHQTEAGEFVEHSIEASQNGRTSKQGLAVPENLLDLVYGDEATNVNDAPTASAHHALAHGAQGDAPVGNAPVTVHTPLQQKKRLTFGGIFGAPIGQSTPTAAAQRTTSAQSVLPGAAGDLDGVSPIKLDPSPTKTTTHDLDRSGDWGNLTDPVVSKRFVSMLHNFDALHADREISASKGEPLKILRGVTSEQWWLVRSERGDVGYVPRDYLSPFDVVLSRAITQVRVLITPPPGDEIQVWFARFDYVAKDENQVTLKKGETLDIVSRPDGKKWWVVQTIDGRKKGFAPATYLTSRLQARSPGRPHVGAPDLPTSDMPAYSPPPDTAGVSRFAGSRLAPRRMMGWLTQKSDATTAGEAVSPDVALLQDESTSNPRVAAAWKSVASFRTRKVLASMGTSVGKTKERLVHVGTSLNAKTKEKLIGSSTWFKGAPQIPTKSNEGYVDGESATRGHDNDFNHNGDGDCESARTAADVTQELEEWLEEPTTTHKVDLVSNNTSPIQMAGMDIESRPPSSGG